MCFYFTEDTKNNKKQYHTKYILKIIVYRYIYPEFVISIHYKLRIAVAIPDLMHRDDLKWVATIKKPLLLLKRFRENFRENVSSPSTCEIKYFGEPP